MPALVAVPADAALRRHSCPPPAPRSATRRSTPAATRRGRRGRCTSCGSSPGPGRGPIRGPWWRNPVCSRSMSPGSTTTWSAAMISSSVLRSTPRQSWPRWWARSTRTPRPCTPLKAMCSKPRWWAKQRWRPPSPAGVGLRSDQVDAGPVPVVVHGLLDPVAVGVELGTDVGERVPLRRVLQREGHHVVGPHVDVAGVAPLVHLAHVDVVEGVRIARACPRSARGPAGSAAGSGRSHRGSRAAGSGRS